MSAGRSVAVHAFHEDALGNTSYLVEAGGGLAIAIDPPRDVSEQLALARDRDLTIAAVLETHLHADFVSGARELAEETGAEIVAAAAADLGFAHRPLSGGSLLAYGDLSIEAIATPGHTPEHLAFLVRGGDDPLVFSGGSLIAGGAARTDLTGFDRAEKLARAQFGSVRALAGLPAETRLLPTHGGGSFCSTGDRRPGPSTIEVERAHNPLLAIEDEDSFVRALLAGFGSYPRYFAHLREVNRTGAPLLRTLGGVPELDPLRAHGMLDEGAWLVDGRPITAWAGAHAAGAVSIEIRPAFASWLGWVVPFGAPVVFIIDEARLEQATRLARLIGYDRLEGWLTFDTWRAAGLPVASIEVVSAREAAARASSGALLLDVRQRAEHAAGHLAGSSHLELGDIIAGKTPDAGEVIAYCGHGERSATAASLLARRGIRVANLAGGASAWRAAGLPTEP